MRTMTAPVQVATCTRCGMQWEKCRGGPKALLCDECKDLPAGQMLASRVTDYRLAIELATSCLRMGRPREALRHLESVAAPIYHT